MKKEIRILSFSICLCLCLCLAACGQNGVVGEESVSAGSDEASANAAYKAATEQTFPTAQKDSMTEEEVKTLYGPYTDWRIYQIRTTGTTIIPADGGQAYYVSNNGDDAADGKTPETAIKSLSVINKLQLKSGDVVYFERGGIWRGDITASVEGVSYSAYGEGRKPEIYASPENAAKPESWEATDAPNVWKYHTKTGKDVGTIIFNQGEGIGRKIIMENGRDVTTRAEFNDYKDLKTNFSFYHARTGELYIYYDGGNPGEKYNSIELCIKEHIFKVRADNVTVDNICFKYSGAHGVQSPTRTGLTVTNCEFAFIGGSVQKVGGTLRYGNGIEIWGFAKNFTVDNCYFRNIFDTGVTFQFTKTEVEPYSGSCENIKFNNNVFEYCNYSIEYFLNAGSEDVAFIKDFEIKNNISWYIGRGLCEQRPDKKENAHIKSWKADNYMKGKFEISNNLFAYATNVLIETYSKNNSPAVYDGNIYVQTEKGKLGINGIEEALSFGTQEVQKITGDKNATVITSPRKTN